MKQNPRPIVSEVAKPSGVGFDELDRTIEPFGAGVADPVRTVVEQTGLVPSEHFDYLFDGFQTAAHGVARPCVKEAFGRPGEVVVPKLLEGFLDTPGAAGLEVCPDHQKSHFSAAIIPHFTGTPLLHIRLKLPASYNQRMQPYGSESIT